MDRRARRRRTLEPLAAGVYRVNIGVGKETFQRLVGDAREPDYAVFDRVLPHPVYAKQRWIAIPNPSEATVRDTVLPLLAEAHDRLDAQRTRQRRTNAGDESS